MKRLLLALLLLVPAVQAQTASEMQSAAPPKRAGETDEQHGRRLLDEMLKALGGESWVHRTTEYSEGSVALFFRGAPTGAVTRFEQDEAFATGTQPELMRMEYLTVKGMIKPGMKRDVAHVYTADNGYELTYKGKTALPAAQVQDYLRRRDHSIEEVLRSWLTRPGVVILAEGTGMRDRQPIDKVSVLTANNDAVTFELDQNTHLPVQRGFEWRNEQFKDHDVDEEVYGDWRMIQGIATPMNMTRYRDGDIVSQTFYTKVRYNDEMAPALFNPDTPFVKH